MDWFALLRDLQGTSKSLLQHHYLKASILRRSAFFMVQLSHPDMTTHKLGGALKELVASTQQVLSKWELLLLPTLSRALCSGLPSSAFTLLFSSHELSGLPLVCPHPAPFSSHPLQVQSPSCQQRRPGPLDTSVFTVFFPPW